MGTRRAAIHDALAIAEVQVASWRKAYAHLLPHDWLAAISVEARRDKWTEVLAAEHAVAVAVERGTVVGFVSAGLSRDEGAPQGTYEIYALYVKPQHWSSGHGTELLSWALAAASRADSTRITLWVIVGNEKAVAFYSKHGFSAEPGTRQAFEIDGTPLQEDRFIRLLSPNGT